MLNNIKIGLLIFYLKEKIKKKEKGIKGEERSH